MVSVDLKITDYCTFGCPYCYQGSTRSGRHADWDYLMSLVDLLYEEDVYEVVLGGGEPTLYPRFWDLVGTLRERGFTVGVTTRNHALFEDKIGVHALLHRGDRKVPTYLGFSLDSWSSLEASVTRLDRMLRSFTEGVKELLNPRELESPLLVVRPHAIEGVSFRSGKELFQVLYALHRIAEASAEDRLGYKIDGVLLLGYKEAGRGGEYLRAQGALLDPASIEEALIKLRERGFVYSRYRWESWGEGIYVFVDAALVDRYPSVFSGDNPSLFREGEYTFYVDAVSQGVAISSYRGTMYPLKHLREDYRSFLSSRKEEVWMR